MRSGARPALQRFGSCLGKLLHSSASCRGVICLIFSLLWFVPVRAVAQDETNQFLFLRLRLKAGEITLIEGRIVSGTLKPQRDTAEAEGLVVSLESSPGEERWSLAIADPSQQRYEYEDPDRPGEIRSKTVQHDDVEFIVRAPLKAGVRHVAVHRKEQTAQQSKPSQTAEVKRLIARLPLPPEVTK